MEIRGLFGVCPRISHLLLRSLVLGFNLARELGGNSENWEGENTVQRGICEKKKPPG
jgi:hypothetical protein